MKEGHSLRGEGVVGVDHSFALGEELLVKEKEKHNLRLARIKKESILIHRQLAAGPRATTNIPYTNPRTILHMYLSTPHSPSLFHMPSPHPPARQHQLTRLIHGAHLSGARASTYLIDKAERPSGL